MLAYRELCDSLEELSDAVENLLHYVDIPGFSRLVHPWRYYRLVRNMLRSLRTAMRRVRAATLQYTNPPFAIQAMREALTKPALSEAKGEADDATNG